MTESDRATETELRAWIELRAGVQVHGMVRQAGGGSREAWSIEACAGGETRRLFLRRDLGTGPVSGTELTLSREAAVCRALADSEVPVPTIIAIDEAHDVVLAKHLDGSGSVADLVRSPARAAVMDDFIRVLAALHNIDPATLDLPQLSHPGDDPSHALDEVALWTRLYEGADTPDPVVRAALVWLADHVPDDVDRTVLVHGDCGPGNFMFDGDRVTAVVDWEFAHFGDATDDLAWLGFRDDVSNGLAFGGDLNAALQRWAELTGLGVDQQRLTYYGLLVLVRCAVCSLRGLHNAGPNIDNSVWHLLLPRMRRAIAHLLADIHGVTVDAEVRLAVAAVNETDRAIATVLRDLDNTVAPAITNPDAEKRVAGVRQLVEHLSSARRLGVSAEAQQLDALTSLLGERPDDLGAARRACEERISTREITVSAAVAGLCLDADLDWKLWEHGGRSQHPYPPLYRPSGSW